MSPWLGRRVPPGDVARWEKLDSKVAVLEEDGGPLFPASPSNGDIYVRTDLDNTLFIYNAASSEWLGPEFPVAAGEDGEAISDQYLTWAGGATASDRRGWHAPFDLAVTRMSAKWSTSISSGLFEVHANGSALANAAHQVTAPATDFADNGLYGSVSSGDELAVFLNNLGVPVTEPGVTIYCRRRAT